MTSTGAGTPRVSHSRRTRTAIVDQHATWIAVDPVQGCPKVCSYCFLTSAGRPLFGLSSWPARWRRSTCSRSPYYAPDRPVALYTWTDAMALPSSRAHLSDLLAELAGRRGPQPHRPDHRVSDP
jgi:hypothetical protein